MTFQLMSDYKKIDGFSYNCPTNVIAGHGALSSIYKAVADLGCRRALILTDPGVNKAGLAQLVKDALADFCVGIYDNIPSDPDLETVDAATAMARELKADCIVSVGGGSVIDTAKGVCVTLKNGGKANDHLNMSGAYRASNPAYRHSNNSGNRQRSNKCSCPHQQGCRT